MLQISIFWVVIIIFAIHTVFTHLFNWTFRYINETDDEKMPLVFIFQLIEIVLIMVWLYSTLP